ncbi:MULTISPECIES: NAD(P)-dependent oxidoreductase [Brevibacillus]|jgi:Putative NADH-flavin reductase|uniref:NAD(P)-binding domain-containing protein n=1 Tax=Brevibacillus parabrevis TaxID=54914 RepID=A0A4Y3PRG1_BREPA|nr:MULTISPECIES: NAD(P)-dependent oxidoreductase [Brevibacillus]TGV17664.1 NAD(P)-dependent oxidoreductase [Mesorhizobium sp. M00.F.Ca.ET.186.01.1.1]MBU8715989.1 NAD(P)-dependent oxidoreductase [Brevibacillus parabrevis]MDH6353082.1 putative NADH-flavin reductase [Brevibacillus sp. 1238]MDR5002660.1 NAD(P)-dependent oxidoreductase [Brevibacillus parabrevis]MED2256971.1 NAD(P)-dependent oxidoreductase [Brevibacillus parabrevis]
MKIAIVGASGKAGKWIMKEALDRGHQVTAVVRDASKIDEPKAAVLEKDVFALTAADLKDFDAVVNAFGAPAGKEHLHVEAGNVLIEAMKGAPSTRLLVVGGAGSLFVDEAKTTRVMETPDFPGIYLATAQNQGENLRILQETTGIQWTFISPSAFFDPEGARTGTYQLGKDHLLVNASGQSYVSYADYAIAVLDEIENPQHLNQRFTVGSN